MSLVADPAWSGRGRAAAAAARLRSYVGRKVLGVDRQPAVHAGGELLPVPGAARATRPAPSGAAGSTTHGAASRRSTRPTGSTSRCPQQFLTFLKNTFTGDLGISLQYRMPVSQLILDRLWPTLLLVGTSTILATRDRRLPRHQGRLEPRRRRSTRSPPAASLTLYSMPEWWLGLLLIAVFGVGFGPVPGHLPDRAGCTRPTSTRTRCRACSTPPGTWCCR